ncbi:glycosyltransferase family 2 protein [Lentzea flaviverrucosa]|uniref:Glycosyl transferase family 2 n=1 Tax=Lentzea flaviverrucosa TaxID=200379 RepID=A0A1H9XVH6_9PSEU|nr:glycosyltransferase family 2 protein [Lentzea flaviverrucosa]RDI18694.1 glycosyl transferase family 2 [Lentzea flaviverrucosa]SES50079.1 Glycosyl transferase family 2 [Lentzea flaviverrucosa]
MTSRSKSLPDVPSLSIVIPVYNEQDWIGRSIEALTVSLERAGWPAEIVAVDDGSTDGTPKRLVELTEQFGITVVSQENAGRFAARQAGIRAATGERILLLDARVIIEPDAFTFLKDQFLQHPDRKVWNGHINVSTDGNPYGGFWAGLVAIGWRRYMANPRLVSFGADEFDVYPKGTGFFCAPRDLLEAAAQSFESLFDDVKLASDDTRMLRWIAERENINLTPDFAATYNSRDSFKKFVKHAYFRGTTFVDSYLDSPGPARNALFAAMAVGVVGLVIAAKFPKTALVLVLLGMVAAGAVARKAGASKGQALAVSKLLPVFAASFGSGVVRGLFLALKKALGR